MKRLLRETLSDFSYGVSRLTQGADSGLRILTYHRVTNAHPEDRLCVPVERFRDQMRHLHEAGYSAVSLSRAVDWMKGEGTVPPLSVAVTFDDGFEDNFRYARPILNRYGWSATFFVPSGFIGASDETHTLPEDRPMTWAHLGTLLHEGHEVGAHSVTHRRLTECDPRDLSMEIQGCRRVLEQRLRRPVRFFCYPSGDYNALVKERVREAGYTAACTVRPGANRPGQDLFALARTEVSAFDSPWDFKKKLSGAYDWLHASVQGWKRVIHS